MVITDTVQITCQLLALLSELGEFKGAWRALGIQYATAMPPAAIVKASDSKANGRQRRLPRRAAVTAASPVRENTRSRGRNDQFQTITDGSS